MDYYGRFDRIGDLLVQEIIVRGRDGRRAVPQKAEDVRMTTVFQKRPDGWQIIAVHMSKAPAPVQ